MIKKYKHVNILTFFVKKIKKKVKKRERNIQKRFEIKFGTN